MTATTLEQLLDASRVFPFRNAIVATLAHLFPCEVKSHPGKLDMEDVTGDHVIFGTPSLNVAVTRVPAAEGRMSGHRDVPVEVAIYLVTNDQAVGARGRVDRDELGLALCDAVLAVLEDPAVSRWGLEDIAPAEQATAMPLFTAKSEKRGTAFYAVTWRQTLYTLGHPFMPLDGAPPNGFAPYGVLPGDPPPPAGDLP